MFQQCPFSKVLRALAPMPLPETVAGNTNLNPSAGALVFAIRTTGRTAGTWAATLQGSIDGSSWYDLSADWSVAGGPNGYRYIQPTRGVPPYLRLQFIPAGGFDGNVEVVARASARLA